MSDNSVAIIFLSIFYEVMLGVLLLTLNAQVEYLKCIRML